MKRAVLAMSGEDFDFAVNRGTLEFSTDIVEMTFSKKEQREGSFQIRCNADSPAEGFVYSTDMRMRCLTGEFMGNEVNISYCFDSEGMEPGDIVKGDFQIISNKGEYFLSFEIQMEQDFLYSSMGPIKNLFHFANLAKTDWQEAVQLYYSKQFVELLSGNDASYRNIYRGLSTAFGNQQNVDEFLVAIKKKDRISYSVSPGDISTQAHQEEKGELTLTKMGWGNVGVDIFTEGDFISVEKNHISDNDFLGNTYRVAYFINPKELHKGRNFGSIIIKSVTQVLTVPVTVEWDAKEIRESENHEWKRLTVSLMRLYIAFRFGKIKLDTWVTDSMQIVEKMTGKEEKNLIARLYQAQLLLASGRVQDARFILERVEEIMAQERREDELYGYYLYLSSLVEREEGYVDKIAHKVKKLYHKDADNFRLAWLMLYLQEELYYHEEKKWDFLEEQYHRGSNSPILLTEAIQLLWENPSLLIKMEEFEISVLRFAIRHQVLRVEMVERIQFLTGREKEFSNEIYSILKACFEIAPSKELLQVICTYIMKGNRVGPEYFIWYELAVKEELKITRLYDFYMLSIDLHYQGELPQMVMMYFAYESNLDYERMAFLYANVLEHKALYPDIVLTYAEHIEKFVRTQISKGRINDHLAYLYKQIITPYMIDVKLANDLAPMLFMYRVEVTDERIENVVVIHDKSIGEKIFHVEERKAFVPIYSEEYQILFQDATGNRFITEESLKKTPVLFSETLLKAILPMIEDKIGIILYCCENRRNYISVNEENVFGFARLLKSDRITQTYKCEIVVNLINYYFEKDYIRELDELLFEIRPELHRASERADFIRILVARGMYDKAFDWLMTFGPEHVENKTILRLCSRLLERTSFEEEERLKTICAYIYRHGKYDENILLYLVNYFAGSTREMRNIYRAADSFAVETYPLLERLIIQMLYSGAYIGEKVNLFETYVNLNGSSSIEKAFLSQCAYEYFVKETIMDDFIFQRIEKMYQDNETLNRVSRLAVLKHYSECNPQEWDKEFILKTVSREQKRNCVFPFFIKFADQIPELQMLSDRSFVEYHGNPGSRVQLHYALEGEDGEETQYRKEEMPNLYGGIFVKSFVMFCGECIQYYITEENGNQEQLTQSSVLKRSETESSGPEWRFSMLNDILLSRELQDEQTQEQLLEDYLKKNYIVNKMFRPD